mmetsp:Transcript_28263/g.66076  ORF Transcript_28263/g.66076 Transcript_28263/m.66076 type:complete len:161 (-) Transcript_28263:271-753(-)
MFAPLLFASATMGSSDIAVCPGEGDRYGDFKCNHDSTHRVCAQLVDQGGKPLAWGEKGDFWEITGQKAFQWPERIIEAPNPGDSWCICMWATASLIERVGCDNVHLRCDATDVEYVFASYRDGGQDLSAAQMCLRKKCHAEVAASRQRRSAKRRLQPADL